MTPDSSPEMAPPPQPVKRLGIGARAVFQLLLAFLILIFTFYLGMTHYKRVDLTQGADFSLSQTTTKLLQSDILQAREEPVKIIAALRKTSPHYARLRALVEEYDHIGNDQLEVDYLDPIRDQDRALEVANNYGDLLKDKLFTDDLFIIDARKKGQDDNAGLRYLPVEQLLVKRTDSKKQRRIVGYRDEDFLSSFLLSALEGKPRHMYLLSDKSDLDVGDIHSPWLVLTEALARQNIALIPIRISEIEKIPDDAEGVVLVAPKYDLEDQEIEILKSYWARPNSAIFATLEPSAQPENLRAFLRAHGVTPRNDRVLAVKNGRTETQVRALFLQGSDQINDGLADKATTFEGKISSLEILEGAEHLASQRIESVPLISASAGYWGETDYTQPKPKFEDAADFPGPLHLAARVIKGNANADNTADLVSKMIVISTSDFLHPERLREEQLDFVKNSTNWLLGREELMGIGPRALERRKLNLIPSEVGILQKIVVFFIPAGLLLIGLFIWNIRRA